MSCPKIRHRKRKYKENDIGNLLETRKKLKLMVPTSNTDKDIEEIEAKIVAKTEEKCFKLILRLFLLQLMTNMRLSSFIRVI